MAHEWEQRLPIVSLLLARLLARATTVGLVVEVALPLGEPRRGLRVHEARRHGPRLAQPTARIFVPQQNLPNRGPALLTWPPGREHRRKLRQEVVPHERHRTTMDEYLGLHNGSFTPLA